MHKEILSVGKVANIPMADRRTSWFPRNALNCLGEALRALFACCCPTLCRLPRSGVTVALHRLPIYGCSAARNRYLPNPSTLHG